MAARSLTVFSPAKINLLLAITGRRTDGFHELVSVVAPLTWGDELRVERVEGNEGAAVQEERVAGNKGAEVRGDGSDGTKRRDEPDGAAGLAAGAGECLLECDDPAVPRDGTNLVLKAAAAFAAATAAKSVAGGCGGVRFTLEKRIPIGAGLGGGSSNAAAALRALNELAGRPLGAAELAGVAAGVGSDCALFLHDGPVVMRGRGERVEPLPAEAAARLSGRRVLVFKPAFGISTAWAYGRMAAGAPASYLGAREAEVLVAALVEAAETGAAWENSLVNNMEAVAFRKFPALPVLIGRLEARFGLAPRMSGSGSACFAILEEAADAAAITAAIRAAWGESAFVVETRLR